MTSFWNNFGTKATRRKQKMQQLTQAIVEKLEPGKRRIKYRDTKIDGLVLEIMPSGSKIYRYYKMVNYQAQCVTIGKHPALSLDEARDQAILLSAKLINGERLAKPKDQLTLKDLANLYFNQYADEHCVTATDMHKNFRLYWGKQELLPVSKISTDVIQSRINEYAKQNKLRSANAALTLIKAILNWGVKRKLLHTNPAIGVDKFREQSRDRFVQPHELNSLLDAINKYPEQRARDFFLVCLYTGIRSGNIKAMRWDQVDLQAGTWHIPKTKNGESQTVQLSDETLKILKQRSKGRQLNPWVFPGGAHQPTTKHVGELKKSWKTILKNAGIDSLHIHDLRRTFASYSLSTGTPTAVVQKQLGHKSLAAAAIYQKAIDNTVKEANQRTVTLIRQLANG